jgi:hypothetical protein
MASATFDQFRSLVLRDESLQFRLRGHADWREFSAVCLALATKRGCSLSGADLDAARAAATPYRLEPRRRSNAPAAALDEVLPLGWTPVEFTAAGPSVEWCDLRGLRFDDPFFDQTVRRGMRDPYRLLFRARTSIAALKDVFDRADRLELAGSVLHSSRCGSTLVCRMLRELVGAVVLSEPPVLDDVLRAPGVDDGARGQWLEWMLGALTQRRAPDERQGFVKFDAWAARDLPLIQCVLPHTPWVFLYRDPVAVVASQRNEPSMLAAPGMLPPELFGVDLAGALELGLEDYCAMVVATVCEDALAGLEHGGLAVDYEELPEAVWTRILPHFGISAEPGERARMSTAANRDAKRPYQAFDRAARARAVSPVARSAAERRAGAVYARLQAHDAAQQVRTTRAC